MRLIQLSFVVAIFGLLGACASMEEMASGRRERLLEIYPIGKTSRTDVAEKWKPIEPDLSRIRPSGGWEMVKEPFIAKRLIRVEEGSGKTVVRIDRYYGPDGLFSLCRIWYFFDENNKLIDLEWNYASD